MNDRVIKNPNFKNETEFHRSLTARDAGAKGWPNTHTEVEHLGNGKFAASMAVGHRVFFDKADGNKPKKHKLTDERPGKDYVLIQGAKCCVEVYPYYAKYFDVQHEEVRLYEERWVVQRWRGPPGDWFDVGAWNPVITVEEYPESAGDVVKVTVTYDTDYGVLTVEYFQRDSNNLKHNVTFKNTSGSSETFRVLQRWAGIVGDKVNGKDFPLVTDEPRLAFRKVDSKLAIAENLHSMMFNLDGSEKTDQCLQKPVSIETHSQGMKSAFIYGNWVLAQNKSLEIDPDTATLDDPTEDGYIDKAFGAYNRYDEDIELLFGDGASSAEPGDDICRAYVEWDVSSITDGWTVTVLQFRYEGHVNTGDGHIHEMLGARPSISTDLDVYNEAGEGTIYADEDGFPVEGETQSIALSATARSDLESQLVSNWFAIGLQADTETDFWLGDVEAWEQNPVPKPTLYVEYEEAAVGLENKSANMGAKMMAGKLI